jgi:hypothetical protein
MMTDFWDEDVPSIGEERSNGRAKHQFNLVRFGDIKLSTSAAYLVRGLIPREGLIVVWGPPKCGKTFWCFDLAMHVALGWEYRGRRVETACVVYVACEGERGLAARAEAFRQAKMSEETADPPFYLLTTRLDLAGEVDALILDIAAQIPAVAPVGAICLDTLNRSIRGSESKDEDMSAYIAAADALRDRFKCAVIIIHHCGIDGNRPRGHTSLTAAADAQIAVKRDAQDRIIAEIEWMKDGAEGDLIASRIEVIDVGQDDDGEPITSCVIAPADGPPPERTATPRLTPKDRIALDALHQAIAAGGEAAPVSNHVPATATGVNLDLWRRYYLQGTASDGRTSDARWKSFQRSRDHLQACHAIAICDDFVWTP